MALAIRAKKESIKGGEVISRMLAAEGVDRVFGIIDGTYFGMYSTFGKNGIELITPRHETCAAFMAGAYARTTGRLGVCMASNGPGVANILPGVAVENAEGNRVLLITSCRREGTVYPDRGGTFQYFSQVDVIAPMAKWSCAVPSVDRLAEVMRRAFRTLYSGRPGVVHVDVPESIMNGSYTLDPSWLREPARYRTLTPMVAAPEEIETALEWLVAARRPVIHAGSGVIHAQAFAELAQFAQLIGAPVTTSWAARAAVDERLPGAIPMCYLEANNVARREADLVITLGSRLGETDWWGKAPYWGKSGEQRMIQVDIDESILGVNKACDLPVRADIKRFLKALNGRLASAEIAQMDSRRKQLEKLKKQVAARRKELDGRLDNAGVPIKSAQVTSICQQVFADDAIMVIDGGNTSIWAHFFHEIRTPNSIVGTPKMGMLGAGVAQALGAQVAYPDRQVYCLIGDGAMAMQQQEIETAVRNNLPVIYLVFCDKQWGMVKMNQQFALKPLKTLVMKSLDPSETINTDFKEIAFDRLGSAMGAYTERVSEPASLKSALRRALDSGRCAVIHVDVDPVDHMWAPNLKEFKDMHAEPQG